MLWRPMCSAALMCAVVSVGSAQVPQFVDWTSVDAVNRTASGTIASTPVTLSWTESGMVPTAWLNNQFPGFSSAVFTPALATSDALEIIGRAPSQSVPTYTISFATPVLNPILHIASNASVLEFRPVLPQRLSGDERFLVSANQVVGSDFTGPNSSDANGTIRFGGLVSSLEFTARYPGPAQAGTDGIAITVGGGVPGSWVQLGPAPAHLGVVEGMTDRPATGAVNAVVAHPSDPDVLVIGAVNGGIWRTNNATAVRPNWTQLTDGLRTNSVRALSADPTVANLQSLVAGTGRNSSINSIGGAQVGMLRSTDGGTTWAVLDGGGTLADRNIAAVAARGSTLLAASTSGLYRSTDTGISFALLSGNGSSGLPTGTVTDLVADPANLTVLYLAAMGSTRGIYRSADTGATWVKVSDPVVDATLVGGGNVRLASSANGQIWVAVVISGRLSAVFRYAPASTTWVALGVPTTSEQNGALFGAHPGAQGSTHLSIAADPANADIVYIGGDRQPCFSEAVNFEQCFPNSLGATSYSGRLFRGTVGGNPIWVSLTHSGAGNNSAPHADSRGMSFDANGDLIEVDDGGIYKRLAPQTTAGSWVSLNGNLAVTEVHGISYDSLSDHVYGGTQDTGTVRQVDTTQVFTTVSTGDGGDTAIDNVSSSSTSTRFGSLQWLISFFRQVYAADGALQSTSFPALLPLGGAPAIIPQFYTPIASNTVNGLRLVFLASNGVYESTDQGATVSRIATVSGNALVGDPLVYGVPGNAEFLYFASNNGLFLRTASGDAPTQRATLAGLVFDVTVDPASPSRLFAMTKTTVHLSTNSGSQFSDITGNLPALSPGELRTMAFVSGSAGPLLVVGTARGTFAAPGPEHNLWSPLGGGLPNAPVFELEYNATRDVLVAGLLGRGTWRLDAPAQAVQTIGLFQNGFEPIMLNQERAP